MPKTSDSVTWVQLGILISAAIAISGLSVGGGFAWLHSEVSDLKTELHDTGDKLNVAITSVATQAAATNGKLDVLIQETQRTSGRRN